MGGHIAHELRRRGLWVRALARRPEALASAGVPADDIVKAEVTEPASLAGCCDGIDVVITTVGITRQKDGLSYMDVDYQANMNLLAEAQRAGVRRFVYVSVLQGEQMRDLKICDAKERFVDDLRASGMNACVIRPNGFFSDMGEILGMARQGRVWLFGDGQLRSNPIDGADLAVVCADALTSDDTEVLAGGPQVMTQNQIAQAAFDVLGQRARITHLPDGVRRLVLWAVRTFAPGTVSGPIEFFLTVMAREMVAPLYGRRTLRSHFEALKRDSSAN
ncbi:SDR family oxidoreductase [Hydrogenophaga sp. 5NK40-0174]